MLTVFGWHCWVWNTFYVPKAECLSVRVKEAPEPALTAMQWCHAVVPFSAFSYRLVCFWGEKELTSCRTKQQPSIRETTACSQAKGTAGWLIGSVSKSKGAQGGRGVAATPTPCLIVQCACNTMQPKAITTALGSLPFLGWIAAIKSQWVWLEKRSCQRSLFTPKDCFLPYCH